MEEVDIVKTYQPLLADADKIDFLAQPASQDTAIKKLTYEVKDHLIEVPYTPAEMRVVSLPADSVKPLQNNILKAGFGTQLTPLLDLQLHNGHSDKLSYGLEVNHLSSNASKIAFQDFSKQEFPCLEPVTSVAPRSLQPPAFSSTSFIITGSGI
jgi:hypothetical protein